jgi:hypothetical protein
MIDLTSLFIAFGLFLSLIVGDAAYFGNPLDVHITIPPKLADTGFTQAAAEELFAAEVADIGVAASIVPTPNLELSTRPSLATAVAAPLKLESLVIALQSRIGVEVTTIHGTILDDAKTSARSMVIVISPPREPASEINLSRDDGDARVLVHQAARLAMEQVAPYRVALTDFTKGLDGDQAAFVRSRDVASRTVARPWTTDRATEQVMVYNLLGLLAVAGGDVVGAEAQFRRADTIPGALSAAYGTVSLNRTFLAVAARQPVAARHWFDLSREQTEGVQLPGWSTEMNMLGGLVAWSAGDLARAEVLLRAAVAAAPSHQGPHIYLAQVLAARGDAAGAATEQTTGSAAYRFNARIPSLAQSEFWVDPVHGGVKPRQ